MTLHLEECKCLSITGVALKPFATSTDHSWLGGRFWGIMASLGSLFHAGSDIFAGREGVAFFREITEYIGDCSLVISYLQKAFMSTVPEGFDITLCQVTKVLALSSNVCSIFPAPRLDKLCHLLGAIALPLEEPFAGVAAVAPGQHRPPALAQPSLPPAKDLQSAENKKD